LLQAKLWEGGSQSEKHAAELQQQLAALQDERTSLHAKLREAGSQSEKHAADHAAVRLELSKAMKAAKRLQEELTALRTTTHNAEEREHKFDAERRQALTGTRREVEQLRRQCEELMGENASLAADLAAAAEENEQLRSNASQEEAEAAVAKANELAEQMTALEERAAQAETLQARLQEAWAVTTRLEGELALAQTNCKELNDRLTTSGSRPEVEALRVERDRLAQRVLVLEAELNHEPQDNRSQFDKAVEAAFAEVVRGRGEPAQPTADRVARGVSDAQRTALTGEIARLRQENAQLRQWLAQCGVMPM
jgi:chromosome segregation ATPase